MRWSVVNIDGFNAGEKTETYWAIRSYEIAIEEGIKFFVYGNLDYALKKSGTFQNSAPVTMTARGVWANGYWLQNQVNKDRMGSSSVHFGPLHRDGDHTENADVAHCGKRDCDLESTAW